MIACVILAGGLATRLGEHARDLPKCLLNVAGRPFLEHQLQLLGHSGVKDVVLCIGHLGDLVEAHVHDGSRFGVRVRYSRDGAHPLGTGGATAAALDLLGEPAFVMYGDTYLRIDFEEVWTAFRASALPALMCVLENDGAWDHSNVRFDGERVTAYDKRTDDRRVWIDYGLSVIDPGAMPKPTGAYPWDLAELFRELSYQGRLAGFEARDRFYEIGTPTAAAEASAAINTLHERHRGADPSRAQP